MLGGVHEDIDLAADVGCKIGNRLLVADIERHDLDALQRPQRILAAERLPRFGDADEHDRRTGRLQRGCYFLADDAAPVGHQNAPEFRIGRHFTPLPVVRHVGGLTFGVREGYRLPALVQLKRHHDLPAFFAIGMQMRHHGWPALHRDQADAPWRTLAEMHVGRDMQRRFAQKCAARRCIRKSKVGGKARRTGIARRIGERPASAAALQHEAPFGGSPRETVRSAAARARRRRRQPRPQQRILPAWPYDRFDHEVGPARIAAPEARPRS